uniref:Sensory/regulatory protein RpfC n=1 Tax=uncultured bacterium contig00049 TaxID=1181534 RepID=A0A806KNM1_9BACT|nr:sensory box histidine kinase/response regulator [uncultured bacterium contig00049]
MIVLSLLLAALLSCVKSGEIQGEEIVYFSSFRDVPGVTADEIHAIETLRSRYSSFIYGMPLSTEAFETEDGTTALAGEVGGYAKLICEWLSDFFEIPFKPKLYEWLDLLARMETGEVSFSGELTATPERYLIYHMTSDIASRPLKYFTISGSESLSDIARTRPIRCGFISGTATINTVVSELRPGTFELVLLDDVSLVYDALKSKRIDAFYYSGTAEANFVQYHDMIANQFYPLIYRPVSLATQVPALAPIISVVEKFLENGGIRYLITLYNQGEQEYLKYKLFKQLTDEERAFLDSSPVIKVGIDPHDYPNGFFDRYEKKWKGIFFDILDDLTSLTGITFQIFNNEKAEWSEIYQMLMDGKISMVPELNQSADNADWFLWPSSAQAIDYYALISKSNFRNIKINEVLYCKVGLVKDAPYTQIFKKWFPHHMNTVEYNTLDDAFVALRDDKVEMVMATQMKILYLTHYLEQPGFKAMIFDQPVQVKIGFNKDEILLHSVVNKALGMVDTKSIANLWLRKTYDYRTKMAEAQLPWLVGVCVLLFFLLTLILFIFRDKLNEGKRLETQVHERTVELRKSRQELEKALELAKAADRSKSAFLANMSHEIRTPMNSILGFSELATDNEVSPKTKDYLDKIHKNAEWLLQIINDILDISKIESGKLTLEKIPFDMHELFVSCRTLVLPKATEKGILLHFYAEPSLGKRPLGDPTRLRQVFVNLLSNAVKFTNTGIIKLYSAIKSSTASTITMHFEIRDSGIGMTSEQVEKVFEPFIQAESGTTRKFGGTGLGLSITKNIVEMMGGKIKVESAPGVGSKFSFDLTFDTIDISDNDVQGMIVLHEIEKPTFEGEVLLCEDNNMNQQVICEHLARVGLKSVIAENGKIGVDMVKKRMKHNEKQFDLIFMDMHMPVMDGLEASAEILKLGLNIPIVALTANIMSSDIAIYKASGMNDYVGKPFTSQELWRCLMKYFTPVSIGIGENNLTIEADKEFMHNLQLSFYKNNQRKYEEIVAALEAGDIKLAHRLVHTLKSNAGQIGKTILQKAAASVEHLLKGGTNLASQEDLRILDTELTSTLNELAPLIYEVKDQGGEIPVKELNPQETRELLEKLEPLLKTGNTECLNYKDELRGVNGSEVLLQQMDDFDFESAILTLKALQIKNENENY